MNCRSVRVIGGLEMINDALQAFVDSINDRNHLLLLLDDTSIIIHFKVEDERTMELVIRDGKVSLNQSIGSATLEICGEVSPILMFIKGQAKLTDLLDKQHVSVNGAYKHLLKVESLFRLGGIDQSSSNKTLMP